MALPFGPGEEAVAGTVLVREGSVATSSPLGQTRGAGRSLVGHIVDPARGPVRAPVLAALVWSPSGTDADALTKVFVLRGPQAAATLRDAVRYEAVVVLAEGVARPREGTTGTLRRIGKVRGRDVYATPDLPWAPPGAPQNGGE
jgi:thiamine biosynthesis lipoprotein ApbE